MQLITTPQAEILISEATAALMPGGHLVIYGPFLRGGALTRGGDIAIHQSQTGENPEIGFKDDFDTLDMIASKTTGLTDTDQCSRPDQPQKADQPNCCEKGSGHELD